MIIWNFESNEKLAKMIPGKELDNTAAAIIKTAFPNLGIYTNI